MSVSKAMTPSRPGLKTVSSAMLVLLLVRWQGRCRWSADAGRGGLIVPRLRRPETVRGMERPAAPARISQAALAAMRRESSDAGLDERQVPPEPIALWRMWLPARPARGG